MKKGPIGGLKAYELRRKKLYEQIGDGVAIVFAKPEETRNSDVPHPYRQDSTFFYLTGFVEPDSVAVFNPSSKTPFTFFVRPRDPGKEIWDGFRYGVEGAKKHFGADQVFEYSELEKQLPSLLESADVIYYHLSEELPFNEVVFKAAKEAVKKRGRTGLGNPTYKDLHQIVGEMRIIKTAEEQEFLKKACDISAEGHLTAMKTCRPGIMEYEVEAELLREFRRRDSKRVGYESIVGSGENATILHYVFNDSECKDGDLLLIDAGAEYGHMTGDITRTFPVNGKFTEPQKEFYQAVLDVQKALVEMVKPGIGFYDLHDKAIELLSQKLIDLKILKGDLKQVIESKSYRKYFPHGTGHWLGSDVHDVGLYRIDGEVRKLEPGMSFTIEPGLYVRGDDKEAPEKFRGMGVRIEDDILVTSSGYENLTKKVPKEVSDIEAFMQS